MRWFNLSKRDVGTTPQSVWDAVNKFATAANDAIPGTAIEDHVKIYSQDIIARFVGICADLFHDESSVAYIARIMEGDAKGIPMNMESFHDRSSTTESERLGNASAAITRWTQRRAASDEGAAALWTAPEVAPNSLPPPPPPPPPIDNQDSSGRGSSAAGPKGSGRGRGTALRGRGRGGVSSGRPQRRPITGSSESGGRGGGSDGRPQRYPITGSPESDDQQIEYRTSPLPWAPAPPAGIDDEAVPTPGTKRHG
jgi:hypothetical protein